VGGRGGGLLDNELLISVVLELFLQFLFTDCH